MSKYHAKKYVFFCDKCEIWYDRNESMEKCSCGESVRLLEGEEESYFWCRLSESAYEIGPYKEREAIGKTKGNDGNLAVKRFENVTPEYVKVLLAPKAV